MEPLWQPHPQGCPQVSPGLVRHRDPTAQGRPQFCDLKLSAPMVDSCPCFGYVWLDILAYFGMCFLFSCALGADLDLGSLLTQSESQQLVLDRNAKQRSHDVPSFLSMTSQIYLAGFFKERFKNLSLWKELS